MIAWWWIPIAIFAGIVVGALGVIVIAFIGAPTGKDWWRDE